MFTEIVTFEIPNLPAALKEVHGVIKSNGLLISKTPCLGGIYQGLWPLIRTLQAFGKARPLRFISPARLEKTICEAGFVIEDSDDPPRRPPSQFIVARRV